MILLPAVNRFLHWSVVGIASPVLVLMIVSKDVALEAVGVPMALMSAAVVVCELPSGLLSDLIGRRRVYLLSLLVGLAARAALLALRGAAGVCAGLVLYGASRALSSGSIESAYIDEFIAKKGKEALPRLIAAMGAAECAGLAAGALAGGWIPALWARVGPGGGPYDGNILAQALVLCALVALTLCSRCGAQSGDPRARLKPFLAASAAFLRGSRTLRAILIGLVFWGLLFSAIELFWQPRLQEIAGVGRAQVLGLVSAGYFLASMLGSLALGAARPRSRAASLKLIAGLRALVGLAVIALALQARALPFAAFYLATMLLNGMATVPEAVVLNSILPEDKRASFLSLASLAAQVGGIAGSLAFGLAKRYATIGSIWIVAAALFLLSAPLYLRAARAPAA